MKKLRPLFPCLAMLAACGLAFGEPGGADGSGGPGARAPQRPAAEADSGKGMAFTDSKSGKTITINPGEGVFYQPGQPLIVGSGQSVLDAIRAKAEDPNLTQAEKDTAVAIANMLQAASSQAIIEMVDEAVRNYQRRAKPGPAPLAPEGSSESR